MVVVTECWKKKWMCGRGAASRLIADARRKDFSWADEGSDRVQLWWMHWIWEADGSTIAVTPPHNVETRLYLPRCNQMLAGYLQCRREVHECKNWIPGQHSKVEFVRMRAHATFVICEEFNFYLGIVRHTKKFGNMRRHYANRPSRVCTQLCFFWKLIFNHEVIHKKLKGVATLASSP
jgi:hypothetical protein